MDEEDESEDEPMEEKEDTEKPPTVELSAEDKALHFRKQQVKDLSSFTFSTSFSSFSVPENDEGFDEIKYEWFKTPSKCKEFLSDYKLNRKINTRVEDIVPSTWFHQEWKR